MMNDISKINSQHDTLDIFEWTLKALFEGITGIASSDRKDWGLSIGYLCQRLRGGKFLKTLSDEWNKYREKGEIKDDYMSSEQHQACLQEMLDFLDKDSPDEIRFSFLKKILLITATETTSDRNSVIPQQFMKICRSLSSGEILVMQGAYSFFKNSNIDPNDINVQSWLNNVARESGLKYPSLVESHESELERKKIITDRLYSDKSGVKLGKYYRLTDLGYQICKFIESYDSEEKG
jgi:hypothetical protein